MFHWPWCAWKLHFLKEQAVFLSFFPSFDEVILSWLTLLLYTLCLSGTSIENRAACRMGPDENLFLGVHSLPQSHADATSSPPGQPGVLEAEKDANRRESSIFGFAKLPEMLH